ncbi:hypothetical protein N2152v2_004147 [Parachlorella kessleri]
MAQPQYPPYGANPQYGQYPQQPGFPAANPWQPGPQQGPQQFYVPPEAPLPPQGPNAGLNAGLDPNLLMTGFAGNMLRQQGQTYLARVQAYVQPTMGFLSGGIVQYHFSITPEYVRSKLLMLLAPFLKKWHYTRTLEQISGGHKYLPPRQDVNAPDLYIPLVAVWSYCILRGVAALAVGKFQPDMVYNTASSALLAWLLHTLVLRIMMAMLGIGSVVPFLELVSYAGYAFVPACGSLLAAMTLGGMGYHIVWAYGSLCMAIFLVRTMKRVIFQEARHYSLESTTHNYLLLGLAVLQFPFNAWLARLPA